MHGAQARPHLQRQETIEDYKFGDAFDTHSDDFFDITRSRVLRVFEAFDVDDDGRMTSHEFRHALTTMGVTLSDLDFCEIMNTMDLRAAPADPSAVRISFAQFERVVRRMRLEQLFKEDIPGLDEASPQFKAYQAKRKIWHEKETCVLSYCDYSGDRLRMPTVVEEYEMRDWFLTPRPIWTEVRWINIDRMDSPTLKRLAVKYRLHPLALEDALSPATLRQRVKIERYLDPNWTEEQRNYYHGRRNSNVNVTSGSSNGSSNDNGSSDDGQGAEGISRRNSGTFATAANGLHGFRPPSRNVERQGFIHLLVPTLHRRTDQLALGKLVGMSGHRDASTRNLGAYINRRNLATTTGDTRYPATPKRATQRFCFTLLFHTFVFHMIWLSSHHSQCALIIRPPTPTRQPSRCSASAVLS